MIIHDISRRCPDRYAYVNIPVYHLGHLGFQADMEAEMCLLPGQSGLPELVVSSFAFDRWQMLWRLTASLRDRPGLIHDITDTLRRHDINIVAEETGTVDEQNLFQIEMILDIPSEKNADLARWSLQARLLDDINIYGQGEHDLKLRPLRGLNSAKQAFVDMTAAQNRNRRLPFSPIFATNKMIPHRTKTGARQLRLRLPSAMRDALTHSLTEKSKDGKMDWGYHMRVSDTKDRFLRVLYYRTSDPILFVRIDHEDRIGAMADIAGALRAEQFSLLSSVHTRSPEKSRARLEVLVRREASSGKNSDAIKRELCDALANTPSNLQIRVSYPEDYVETYEETQINHKIHAVPQKNYIGSGWIGELGDKLETRYRTITKEIENQGFINMDTIEVSKSTLINRLLGQYEKTNRIPPAKIPKRLFVSCDFNAGPDINHIINLAKRHKFTVVTGKSLETYASFQEGILDHIKSCTHFLGIWTPPANVAQGWPSPWLLWELGVAASSGLSWRLLINDGVSKEAWHRLRTVQQQIEFTWQNYESQLRHILKVLADTPHRREV